ncbi:hypothetical protein [Tardiphaga robiniae]|uniref:Uncharacterized protein n=1 Tax=Tardiphaga robiniae TaxID=943830 RepID=A0A163Y050_9BRAD|nr:hypothetical protein [Tardiphaga robiniae]KZD21625.1 hypothetical protein A4A58_14445 [Tardiphaga robiniae]
MSRFMCLLIALVLSLTSAVALAAPAKKKQQWKGYGFLPGYHQPLNNSVPLFMQKRADLRMAKRDRRHWYIDRTPVYYRWSDGEKYYFGRPGFYRGQYNGGSMGPCWTRTPIGPIWNCG